MQLPEIETARLQLRRFKYSDLDALSEIFSDKKAMEFLESGKTLTKKETEIHLNNYIELYWKEYKFGRWALINKENGELIGHCGFRMFNQTPELVFLLARPYWRRGFVTEAASGCLRYIFETLSYPQIKAVVLRENTASIRLLEKLGMVFAENVRLYDLNCALYEISKKAYKSDQTFYQLTYTDFPSNETELEQSNGFLKLLQPEYLQNPLVKRKCRAKIQ